MVGEGEWNSVGFFIQCLLSCGFSVVFLGAMFACGYNGVRVAAFFFFQFEIILVFSFCLSFCFVLYLGQCIPLPSKRYPTKSFANSRTLLRMWVC